VTPWQTLDSQTLSGSSAYIYTGISTSIRHLWVIIDLTLSSNAANLAMQFYNSSGMLDSGSTSYNWMYSSSNTAGTGGTNGSGAPTSSIALALSIANSSSQGISGDIRIQNIQGVKDTQCNFDMTYLDSGGTFSVGLAGSGTRLANGNITGVKIFPTVGTASGTVTLLGSTN
jgi:hypothetical protein